MSISSKGPVDGCPSLQASLPCSASLIWSNRDIAHHVFDWLTRSQPRTWRSCISRPAQGMALLPYPSCHVFIIVVFFGSSRSLAESLSLCSVVPRCSVDLHLRGLQGSQFCFCFWVCFIWTLFLFMLLALEIHDSSRFVLCSLSVGEGWQLWFQLPSIELESKMTFLSKTIHQTV